MDNHKKTLAIIGGGATGACLLINSKRILGDDFNIILIDPSKKLGRGRAYDCADHENLLNVAAANMGIHSHRPEDFLEWLSAKNYSQSQFPFWPFVPRKIYGDYLEELICQVKFEHIRSRVQSVAKQGSHFLISMSNGGSLIATHVVVATGYCHVVPIKIQGKNILQIQEAEKCILKSHSKVLILGSGLTAIDLWKRFRQIEDVQITMLSRRGLTPLPHFHGEKIQNPPRFSNLTPLEIYRKVRALNRLNSHSWQQIADELRLQSGEIWNSWSGKQKKQFLRHLKPYWEVMRHRMPKLIADLLESDLTKNQTLLKKGYVQEIKQVDEKVMVRWSKNGTHFQDQYDYVVFATGYPINQWIDFPGAVRSLNGLGYIKQDDSHIWFAGPSSKEMHWEITAIPDIRVQVEGILREIVS